MEKVEEYFLIELSNSKQDTPDYLHINNSVIKWISVNVKAGNIAAQKEIAKHQATSFKSEKEARELLSYTFGKKHKGFRITRHFRYV